MQQVFAAPDVTTTKPIGEAAWGASSNFNFVNLPVLTAFTTTELITAITTLSATTGGTILLAAALYDTTVEIPLPAAYVPIQLIGQPWSYNNPAIGTVIRAVAPMRSVFAILATHYRMANVRVNANRQANYGIYGNNFASSNLNNVLVENALFDGLHADIIGINDSIQLDEVWAVGNGTLYRTAGIAADYALYAAVGGHFLEITGTAATTAGNATIVLTGAPDITTYGARKGDFIRVGSFFGQIESVTASTVDVQTGYRPTSTVGGLDFAIGIGHGINAPRQADNNIWKVHGGLWRANAAAGSNWQAIFGPRLWDSQADLNAFYGVAIGHTDGGFSAVKNGGIYQGYFEGNVAGSLWLYQWFGCLIDEPEFGAGSPSIRPIEISAGSPTGILRKNGFDESLLYGAQQSFVISVRNNAGVIEHRITSERFNANTAVYAYKLADFSNVYIATPLVSNVVGFTEGAGVLASSQSLILLDSINTQSTTLTGVISVEFENTGSIHRVFPRFLSSDINGVTINRVGLVLIDGGTGAAVNWTALAINTQVDIRVDILMR